MKGDFIPFKDIFHHELLSTEDILAINSLDPLLYSI